jgi:TP901 family phage tail tape measure protein
VSVKVGTLSADLDLDGNPFEKNLDRAMQTGAQKAAQIGDKMTARVTLPLVAAGGAAAKMGMDFETSMSRIVGLVGVSTSEVDELRSGVLELSGATAKGPQELADALFTVTSAGFRGGEAMDVLTAAAKASAAGLGETNTIAQALTGAVNAYGPEVLDAARATDILVATARAGNFESSQLAGVLGKITPFAKQAGASLEDVGGAIALLTRVNNNATESGTQVAAMMRAFVAPGADAVKTFERLYGSTQAFRDIIASDGVVAALQDLDGKLGGSREELAKLLGSSEAASAAFQILDADAATLEDTFGTVTDSVGMTDEAFAAAAETSGFKMQQALARLQAALIDAGDAIAPFVVAVAGGIGTAAEAFSKLPDPVKNAAVGVAALLAATGPLLSIGGRLAQNLGSLSRGFDRAATGAYDAAGKIGTFSKVLGGLAIAAVAYQLYQMAEAARQVEVDISRASRATTDELVEGFLELERWGGGEALEAFSQMAEGSIGTATRLRDALAALGHDTSELDEILRSAAEGERQMASDADAAAGAIDGVASSIKDLTPRAADGTSAVEGLGDASGDAAAEMDDLTSSITDLANELAALFDPLFAAEDATRKMAEAQQAVTAAELELTAAQNALNEATKAHGPASDEAAEAARNLMEAQEGLDAANRDTVRSAYELEQKQLALAEAVRKGDVDIDAAIATLNNWVAQGHITQAEADITAGKFRDLAGDVRDVPDNVSIEVWAHTEAARKALRDLDNLARSMGGPIIYNASIRARDHLEGRWTGGPLMPGKDYMVGEHGPEVIRMGGGAGVVENAGQTRAGQSGASGRGAGKVEHHRHVHVNYPPDKPSTKAISHELMLIEMGNP